MNIHIERQLLEYRRYKIMTYSTGAGQETLLILHGGPGVPSDYMRESHFEFYVKKGLRVVTWDQLGCGEFDQPDDDALWELPRFVEEVEHVRRKLNLKAVHLLGQSWGGVLGLEYCLAYPEWVKSFISANSSFNIPLMQRGFERHKMALGAETCRMMARREAEGTTDHPEYYGAYTLLAHRHICRAEVWPESLVFSMANIAKPVLSKVFGNYLFNCTGLLRNYDRTEELKKVNTPILVIHGEYDYIVVECATHARDNLINAELVVLHDCSHDPFFEKPELYHQAVWRFLQKHTINNC